MDKRKFEQLSKLLAGLEYSDIYFDNNDQIALDRNAILHWDNERKLWYVTPESDFIRMKK